MSYLIGVLFDARIFDSTSIPVSRYGMGVPNEYTKLDTLPI